VFEREGAAFAACDGEGGGTTSVRGGEGTPSSAAEEDFSPGRPSDLGSVVGFPTWICRGRGGLVTHCHRGGGMRRALRRVPSIALLRRDDGVVEQRLERLLSPKHGMG
jgi:hypothetical protein